jgi:hypothetical protein
MFELGWSIYRKSIAMWLAQVEHQDEILSNSRFYALSVDWPDARELIAVCRSAGNLQESDKTGPIIGNGFAPIPSGSP